MLVRDVMSTNVVTISSSTSLADARQIMEAHRIRRIPVVDKGKLVGIVTRDALDKAGPSKLTTFSIQELTYLLGKLTVKEAMVTGLVTISPDATVEESVSLAQSKKVGALLVIEKNKLIGIVTTNDLFYRILNPILGIGKGGVRIHIHNCGDVEQVTSVLKVIREFKVKPITMFTLPHPETGITDFTIHLDTNDATDVIAELTKIGHDVHERAR
jgi:acetoin utilization protein AcuB